MLVTCPECGARYEMDGSLVPPEGRRVQCTACDHVWHQAAAGSGQEPAAGFSGRSSASGADEETPRAPPPLSDEVRAILREEAQRDTRVRRERGLVGIEPEMALGAAAPAAGSQWQAASRPIPDAEATNAALRAASERAAEASGRTRQAGRGGFAAGLVVGLLLVGIAAAIYLAAPRISEAVPAAAPLLASYVEIIDDLRVTLGMAAERAIAVVAELMPSEG